MAHTINIGIVAKVAKQINRTVYVCGNSDFSITFSFDAEWAQHDTKTARFSYGGSYVDVVFRGNVCPVPIITDTHTFKVGVFAGNLHTTTPAIISAKKSILDEFGTPASPPDDVYNQIMVQVDEAAKASDNAVKQAGESAAQAAASATQAEAVKGQITTEEAARQKAEAARAQAEKERSTAEANRASAESDRKTAEQSRQPAETSRDTAEKARASAEKAREQAEAERAEAFAAYEAVMEGLKPDNDAIGGKTWSSKHLVDMLCLPLEASGNPVQLQPISGYPLNVIASWEPTQVGSGTPSPENVRPISGRDVVKVERCGENLSQYNGESDTVIDNFFFVDRLVCKGILPDTQYTFQLVGISNVDNWFVSVGLGDLAYRLDLKSSNTKSLANVEEIKTITFSVDANDIKKNGSNLFVRPVRYSEPTTATYSVKHATLVAGSTAPPTYTPYVGTTTTLTLPKTIYGGEVDVQTGEGQETWGYIASYVGETLPAEWICDRAVYAAGATPPAGAEVAYKLATPTAFTATGGASVTALQGTNTIMTDADSVTVEGRADPIHTIQQLAAMGATEGATES